MRFSAGKATGAAVLAVPGGLTSYRRDESRVPADWQDHLDPREWVLNEEGLPWRRAARVIALRTVPTPGILLVYGHDRDDAGHAWAFTPGGGMMAGESPQQAAARELAEETGWEVDPSQLIGPVIRRSALFMFNRVTCRQDEEFFLIPPEISDAAASQQIDRSGWTRLEQEVLDDLRWWDLAELEAAVAAGMTIYPEVLPARARSLLNGWDGYLQEINET